jgi:malate dehydrogenase (oxaloacetate-decarboxylating)
MVEILPKPRSPAHEEGHGDRELEEAKSREAEQETRHLSERAVDLARHFGGKIEVVPKVPVRSMKDFAYWYTPGIAEVSREIHRDPELAFELTGRWNTIAIVTDGSRVLGLGDVGPEAALPVMEGKALLFKYLGGVDAFPIPIRTKDPAEIVETVKRLEPALGGVNLEDIASPKCFGVLDELQHSLSIPVWHDDQLGTAAATVAGLINALELTGRKIWQTGIVLLGAGAANLATARLLKSLKCDMGALTVVDHKGILHAEREDIDELMLRNRWKYELALSTNEAHTHGSLQQALAGADVLIAASTPAPGLIHPDWIGTMSPDPIVFALANPDPEIWPQIAKDAGAGIVATGRSDFPNQVNNSLIFPPVFRGVLDAHAKGIPDLLALEAAQSLAAGAKVKGLTRDHILPTMAEESIFPEMAANVAMKAVELGIARTKRSRGEFLALAQARMARPKELARVLLKSGLLPPMPGGETD